jgi:hypothetical protein
MLIIYFILNIDNLTLTCNFEKVLNIYKNKFYAKLQKYKIKKENNYYSTIIFFFDYIIILYYIENIALLNILCFH